MTRINVELSEIKTLTFDGDLLNVVKNGDNLEITTAFMPEVVDNNFREVEVRLNQIDNTIRTTNINLNKLENKVNIINALNQGR